MPLPLGDRDGLFGAILRRGLAFDLQTTGVVTSRVLRITAKNCADFTPPRFASEAMEPSAARHGKSSAGSAAAPCTAPDLAARFRALPAQADHCGPSGE